MDDLSGFDCAGSKGSANQQSQGTRGNYYPTLRPTPPLSGRSTPSSVLPTRSNQKPLSNVPSGSKSSTPANDSFADLVSFSARTNKHASLEEQQRILQEQKMGQEAERKRQFDSHFGLHAHNGASWDTLGEGRATPKRSVAPPTYTATEEYGGQKLSKIINKPFAGIPKPSHSRATQALPESDNDLLAAFDASAPVDASSHMPISSRTSSFDGTPEGMNGDTAHPRSPRDKTGNGIGAHLEESDDDPFGLGAMGSTKELYKNGDGGRLDQEEDDVLGLLGRPVSEFSKPPRETISMSEPPAAESFGPEDRAIAELVDMGFGIEKSRTALRNTGSGTDVQAAVGWLLHQAHEGSKSKNKHHPSQENDGDGKSMSRSPQSRRPPSRRKSSSSGSAKPAWMKEQDRSNSGQRRQDSKSPANGERDPTHYASELSSNLFKTANTLWKTGTKKLNQAVSEFNSDSDTSQPKWMREAQAEAGARRPRSQQRENGANGRDRMDEAAQRRTAAQRGEPDVTDEALMLESGGARPPRKSLVKTKVMPHGEGEGEGGAREITSPNTTGHPEQVSTLPRFLQQAQARDPRAKLSRQAVEEEAAQAYISPARRKRPTPRSSALQSEPTPDLLFESSRPPSQPPASASRRQPPSHARPTITNSLAQRPPQPKRNIPPLNVLALQTSSISRQNGNEAFKRGDYALATTHYSSALTALPPTHPLTILLLTNRALSHLKTGDPKASLADAIAALDLIGPSHGASETIDLGGDEGGKSMDTYWGKAMTRQAEALEQLERWMDAAAAWRTCVEAGVGGATSIAGRNRCENAARPKPQSTPKRPPARPLPKSSALSDLSPNTAQSAEAVVRLRAANAAADKLDDEKFALSDQVDSRISHWRAGKEGNLRALLASLENVLWEGAGWKKVGMAELVLPGKVKVVYMRGIGRVHPDKVSNFAFTEKS